MKARKCPELLGHQRKLSVGRRPTPDVIIFLIPSVLGVLFFLVGEWLSLVEHLVRDQGVGGSNPLSPTISNQVLADTRRVGEKQGLPQKDLHWRKCFLCGHELPPYSSGSHAHGFNSLFPPLLVV